MNGLTRHIAEPVGKEPSGKFDIHYTMEELSLKVGTIH